MNRCLPSLMLLFLSGSFAATAQDALVVQGDKAMEAGYYKTAYDYYQQAYVAQPNNVDLSYRMAEACRMGNDYEGAVDYYLQVLKSRMARSFPDCHFHLALMYKNSGHPDSALRHFETYIASVPANVDYVARARQEIGACQWILTGAGEEPAHYWVKHESRNINSEASESGAVKIGKDKLLYASMRPTGKQRSVLNDDLVLMQVYQTDLSKDTKPGVPFLNDWGINSKKEHSGNIAIDTAHKTLFFTRCSADNFASTICAIYYMRWNGRRWLKPQRLGGDVNMEGYSSTQPAVSVLPDGGVILFFSSNRPNGMGGFDIWYTLLDSAMKASPCVNLGYPVNTSGNEITPYYSNAEERLYFSSDWHYGYGGYDVFFSEGSRDAWSMPVNLGPSLNSTANDIYFNQNFDDPYSGYLTSNRAGSFFIYGNTCCNDVYRWSSEPAQEKVPKDCPCKKERKEQVRLLLPIALYFDNDRPNPKSKSPVTSLNYFQTYNVYMFRREEYKTAHFSNPDGEEVDRVCREIDAFFDNEVQGNCQKFETFLNLLGQDLKNGHRIRLTIEGYASPLHSLEYNLNLSKRRIATIINQLMEYHHGELLRYMSGDSAGSLQLREVAYGSSHAPSAISNSRADQANSVYSVMAAKERRIEIQDYQYLEDDSAIISCLNLPSRAQHLGTYFVGETADIVLRLPHTATVEKSLAYISVGVPEITVKGYSALIPGKDLVVYLNLDATKMQPIYSAFFPLTLRVEGEGVTQTLFLEYGVQK
ncbi:MAG: hypothetical protein SPJ13_03555 [Bacteroidales bacterium]|nr:hypothetical protein [Bacteroidales bacterium]